MPPAHGREQVCPERLAGPATAAEHDEQLVEGVGDQVVGVRSRRELAGEPLRGGGVPPVEHPERVESPPRTSSISSGSGRSSTSSAVRAVGVRVLPLPTDAEAAHLLLDDLIRHRADTTPTDLSGGDATA